MPIRLIKDNIRSLLGRRGSPNGHGITPEMLQHVFDFSIRFKVLGRSKTRIGDFRGLGESIRIEAQPRTIDFRQAGGKYRKDRVVHLPPHLKWYQSPIFAYVGLVDGRVEYRFGAESEPYYDCPITSDPVRTRQIERMFRAWYGELGLPGSLLTPVRDAALDVDRCDKMNLICQYLEEDDARFLFDVLGAEDGVILWVDWREHDDEIVRMCEALIQTGTLTAEVVEDEFATGLVITYRGVRTRVPYENNYLDRDTTLISLNTLLTPDYELRLCRESDGSDTLAFLPLPSAQWQRLEVTFPNEVDKKFMRITTGSRLFG